jgi:RNA polymerase sigma-70 factor (ECF subfamily)
MALISRVDDEPSDVALIRASHREPAAFELLFERHATPLQQWLLAQTGDPTIAHELLAETFALAWRGAGRFLGRNEGSGAAWLYGIARNLLRHYYRDRSVQARARERLEISTEVAYEEDAHLIESCLDARDLAPSVRTAFSELTSEQREAIRFRVIEEMSYAEVARELSCSTVTARTRVFRGLAALRAAVDRGVAT